MDALRQEPKRGRAVATHVAERSPHLIRSNPRMAASSLISQAGEGLWRQVTLLPL